MLAFSLLLSLSPSMVLASNDLADSVEFLKNSNVDEAIVKEIKLLQNRNIVLSTRPAFCPLNSSRNDAILSSVKNIEAIFKDDCLDGNQGTLDQVLAGAADVQDNINSSRANSGEDPVETPSNPLGDSVDGQQMASLVNGLNTLFNKNKCTSFDDTSFLEHSANVIQDFSQFGLYSPSPTGVSVAYGGLVVGSILKFINNLFEGRFEFKKDSDRVTFIKLNCSFYDVRIKMQQAGILDISTDQHYKDLAAVKKLIKILNDLRSGVAANKKSAMAELSKVQAAFVDTIGSEKVKFLNPLIASLEPLATKPGFPIEAQRDVILDILITKFEKLTSELESYITPKAGARLSRKNRSLSRLVNSLDEINQSEKLEKLETSSIVQFNSYVANLKYHLVRVTNDIQAKKDQALKDLSKVEISINEESTVKYEEIIKTLESGNGAKVDSEIERLLTDLAALKTKLLSITGKREFTSQDGADGADLRILEANDQIVGHIYGTYGEKFVSHMRKKSHKVNNLFKKDFKSFAQKNLEKDDGVYRIKDESELSSDQVDKACVSAKNLRGTWKYSQKWAEMGYDFLSTNKDIFGETDSGFWSNDRDTIFKNSQSAILARRIISAIKITKKNLIEKNDAAVFVSWQGKKLTIKEAKNVINEKFDYTLGQSMLEIQNTRPHNGLLQTLYGQYRCDLRANYEK